MLPCFTACEPCSKSFGERCALQDRLDGVISPNAAKSASLVTNVPSRPFCEGYFHQTILNNCYKSTNRHSGSSRRYTSGKQEVPQRGLESRLAISRRYTSGVKPAWEADFLPDVTRPENREVPQRGLEGRLAISRRYTSGAKSVWKAVFRPNVIRQENRRCH